MNKDFTEGSDIIVTALLNLWKALKHWNKTLRVKKLIKVQHGTMVIAYHFHMQVLRNPFVSSHRHTGSNLQCSCLRACKVDHGTDQASCDKMNVLNLEQNNTVIIDCRTLDYRNDLITGVLMSCNQNLIMIWIPGKKVWWSDCVQISGLFCLVIRSSDPITGQNKKTVDFFDKTFIVYPPNT